MGLVGNAPNQVPTNGDLGPLAFRDENPAGAVVGINTVNNQRIAYAQQQQIYAQQQAAQIGSTECVTRRINDNGIIRETETCNAQVQRPGYQSW